MYTTTLTTYLFDMKHYEEIHSAIRCTESLLRDNEVQENQFIQQKLMDILLHLISLHDEMILKGECGCGE